MLVEAVTEESEMDWLYTDACFLGKHMTGHINIHSSIYYMKPSRWLQRDSNHHLPTSTWRQSAADATTTAARPLYH